MTVRYANEKDIPRLADLLCQVLDVHHKGRPDIFKAGARKYTDAELSAILGSENTPVFVAEDEKKGVLGYAFASSSSKKNTTF